MPIPTSPFNVAKSIFARNSVVEFTPSGGSLLTFETRLLDSQIEQEDVAIELPDSNGILRKVRTVVRKQQEAFTFELVEPKRLLDIFGGALAGRRTGVCTLWIPDPQDSSGYVALKSEVGWPCTVTREGNTQFGGGEFTRATIRIESNKQGAIAWTADAVA